MKVYVLNIESDKERLEQFTQNYPSCLPGFTVWKAKTGEDVIPPGWWHSSRNRWALVQNFIDILSTDTDEDILIFEDDCTFREDFEERYNTFMSEVPDDWDMLYLGAQHIFSPVQVSEHVFRLTNSVCGHAIIYRDSVKRRLIDWYNMSPWGSKHMPDSRRGQGMASGRFKAYSPITSMCGQAEGYSTLINRNRKARWYSTFTYIDLNKKQRKMISGVPEPEIPYSTAMPTEYTRCIVSITSHYPRLECLDTVLRPLIGFAEYHIVLTLTDDEAKGLPRQVYDWISEGIIELLLVDKDYKFHKKFVECFPRYSDKYPIIIIDDDQQYSKDFLDSLLQYNDDTRVVAHCVKKTAFDSEGNLLPYAKWPKLSGNLGIVKGGVPIGMYGILYPRGFKPIFDFGDDYMFSDDITGFVGAQRQGFPVFVVPEIGRKIINNKIIKLSASNGAQKRFNDSYVAFYKDEFMKLRE